ncbi:MAG: ATP-grasp domain-containing protein [Treponema sp.]|nr:ATP-grasp domain-containing protein [Treponema sp.]
MKIVFYSTNSNFFDEKSFFINSMPSWKSQQEELLKKYPEIELKIFTQKPGMFLCNPEDFDAENLISHNLILKDSISKELDKNNFIKNEFNQRDSNTKDLLTDPFVNQEKSGTESKSIQFLVSKRNPSLVLLETDSTEDFVNVIKNEKPDYVIALSFWVRPFDWLAIKDSIVGEKLNKLGIKTICHSVDTTMLCFSKNLTNNFLEKCGLKVPKSVFVQHDLFFCANSKKDIRFNVYKEAILAQIQNLKLPLIAKDNVGLSSYGMQVLNTFGEAAAYLNSKKNNSDRLIQEFIKGEQFGCEVHGTPGNYVVQPLFRFSVNKYGITSPKQSVKFGPITDEKYKLDNLEKKLKIAAEEMKLQGIAQFDLVFDGTEWNIIEINPRLSGMSTTYAACLDCNFYEMILSACNITQSFRIKKEWNYTLNIKFPLLPETILKNLIKIENVKFLCQTEDKAAKQDREMGYCELILSSPEKSQLLKTLVAIEELYPSFVEPQFMQTAKDFLKE